MNAFMNYGRRMALTVMVITSLLGAAGLTACAPQSEPGSTGSATHQTASQALTPEEKEDEATDEAASEQPDIEQIDEAPAAEAQKQQDESAPQQGTTPSSSSSSSTSSGNESASSGAHEHTWTYSVDAVYEDRPTIQIDWDRVHEIEEQTGTQYSPETAFWFMNNFDGVTYEGPAESTYVGNDYYRTCTVCGYSELYDQTRYQ